MRGLLKNMITIVNGFFLFGYLSCLGVAKIVLIIFLILRLMLNFWLRVSRVTLIMPLFYSFKFRHISVKEIRLKKTKHYSQGKGWKTL